jgi:hypothetical protein
MLEIYEFWMKKFCTISIINSWDVKFTMHLKIESVDLWQNLKLKNENDNEKI